MKKYLLIVLAIIITMSAGAQPAWTIKHNNKALLTVKAENESKNIIKIKKTDLNKQGNLSISYIKTLADSIWNRSLTLADSSGNMIGENMEAFISKNNPQLINFPLSNTKFKELLLKHKKLKIYTIAIPSDPAKAAAVRVRRVHICTIELK
jgi:hypothetical protein